MSLARSLTSRMRARFEDHSSGGAVPNRAFSTKGGAAAAAAVGPAGSRNNADKNIDRRLISLPVELLSTSNAQAYEAPDIKNLIEPKQHLQPPHSPVHSTHSQQPPSPTHIPLSVGAEQRSPNLTLSSSASSTHSWEDGLTSPASPALTSASSVTSHEPSREPSPLSYDPNPMSRSFFLDKAEDNTKDKQLSINVTEVVPASPVVDEEEAKMSSLAQSQTHIPSPTAPAIPQRSATHTKQSHQTLARQRSRSRVSISPRQSAVEQPSLALRPASPVKLQAPQISPGLLSTGTDLFPSTTSLSLNPKGTSTSSVKPAEEHPFGAELAKVSELAQEFGAGAVQIVDEETQFLMDNGFRCFGATDYILEIQPLFSRAFGGEPALPVISEWI